MKKKHFFATCFVTSWQDNIRVVRAEDWLVSWDPVRTMSIWRQQRSSFRCLSLSCNVIWLNLHWCVSQLQTAYLNVSNPVDPGLLHAMYSLTLSNTLTTTHLICLSTTLLPLLCNELFGNSTVVHCIEPQGSYHPTQGYATQERIEWDWRGRR